MVSAVKVALFVSTISMWSSYQEIEGGGSGGGGLSGGGSLQDLHKAHHHHHHLKDKEDGNRAQSSVESWRKLRLNKALGMHSAEKIEKRDSWELVAASSDVVSTMDHGKISSDYYHHSWPPPRYNRYTEPQKQQQQNTSPNFIPSHQVVQMRLNKLEYYFRGLRILDEDCRQRFLCEMSKDPPKFYPLSSAFLDETSFTSSSSSSGGNKGNSKDEKLLSARLLTSDEGARLLTYMEATQRGQNRDGCDIWTYRCPRSIESLIDLKSLITWQEVLKWLTVQMVARRH